MNKKKIAKIMICAFLVIIIAGGCVAWAFLPHPLNYDIKGIEPLGIDTVEIAEAETDSVTLRKKDGKPYKIIFFSDIHLDGNNKTSNTTLENMIAAIRKEKPDLVLLGGDNVTSAFNSKRSHQLAEIFEKLGIYWGGVIGNHEGDNPYSIKREKMADIFSSYDRCIMLKGIGEIDGNCNYAINLTDRSGKLLETVFCLDTFDEMSDELRNHYDLPEDSRGIDGAHENQVKWFADKAASIKEKYGEYTGVMLMHIPLPQLGEAAENEENFIRGSKGENVCCTSFDSGLFEEMKKAGISAAYFGHDHNNNFAVNIDGVELAYLETSGYGSYGLHKKGYPEEEWLQGYSVSVVSPGKSTFEQFTYYDALK